VALAWYSQLNTEEGRVAAWSPGKQEAPTAADLHHEQAPAASEEDKQDDSEVIVVQSAAAVATIEAAAIRVNNLEVFIFNVIMGFKN